MSVEHVAPLPAWKACRPVPDLERDIADPARHSSFGIAKEGTGVRPNPDSESSGIILLEPRRLESETHCLSLRLLSPRFFASPLSLPAPLHHSLASLRFPLLHHLPYIRPLC